MGNKLHIIGLGHAGSQIVKLAQTNGIDAKFTCITESLDSGFKTDTNFIRYFPEGSIISHNGDEIKNVDMTSELIAPKEIAEILNEDCNYILFSGLGGYTGTHFTTYIADRLIESKKNFKAICSTPFQFEGKKRKKVSDLVFEKYCKNPNFNFYDLEKIRVKFGDLTAGEAFEKADEELYSIFKNLT
jgi:cell division GTPase FtsZ